MPDAPATETRLMEIVFPNQVNHCGTLFGGHALQMMDMAASIAATRHCRKTVVTVCTEKIEFKVPVKHGELVDISAKVIKTGRTSLNVLVEMHSEDLLSGRRQLCTTGVFVMVAVDQAMKPTPVAG